MSNSALSDVLYVLSKSSLRKPHPLWMSLSFFSLVYVPALEVSLTNYTRNLSKIERYAMQY
jgi:hypothetical protein